MHCLHLIQAIEEQGYFCTNWFSTESWTQAQQWHKPRSWNVGPGGLPLACPPVRKDPGRGAFPLVYLAHCPTDPTPQVLAPKQNKLVFTAHRSSGTCSRWCCHEKCGLQVLSPSASLGILRDLVLTTPWGSGPAPTGSSAVSQPGVPSFNSRMK